MQASGVRAAELERGAVGGVGDRAREEDGGLEVGTQTYRVLGALFREATGHRPHAVRDGAGEAEQAGGEGVQVNGVAVPRGGAVPPPHVTTEPPLGMDGEGRAVARL